MVNYILSSLIRNYFLAPTRSMYNIYFKFFKALFILLMLPLLAYGQHNNSNIGNEISRQLKENYNILPDQLINLKLKDHYVTKHNQVEHFYFVQFISGLEVFGHQLSFHVQNGKVVSVNNDLVPAGQSSDISFSVSDVQAIRASIEDLGLNQDEELIKVYDINGKEGELTEFTALTISPDPIKAEKEILFYEDKLVAVWNIEIYLKDIPQYWSLKVDGNSGAVLQKYDHVLSCSWDRDESRTGMSFDALPAIQHVANNRSVQGSNEYQVFNRPVESPNHGPRTIVSNPADTLASPYGWHDTDAVAGADYTYTRGNNVYVKEDKDANNLGGYVVDGGAQLSFLSDFDVNKNSADYLDAAIVNLFFWNNLMHDVWYHYGFDEPAGNFQQNNYGKGGMDNDIVIADAQDGGGLNNANFLTLDDGTVARMQMYLWGSGYGAKFIVDSPDSIAAEYVNSKAAFGSQLSKTPLYSELVLVDDGTSNSSMGCNALTNSSQLNGKIALFDRGLCSFVQKVKNAQNEGAVAAVIINNVSGGPFSMSGEDSTITIPALMISQEDGELFKSVLANSGNINVVLYDSSESDIFFDSDFDNGIISHEYGHGISNRLTGGPSTTSCLSNEEQMGEGWSDFFGMVMTHEPGDSGTMKRGKATYARGQSTDGNGIRPFPYSTDLSINPTTYSSVKDPSFTTPHGVGSVWCQMLLEMYWAFIEKYGYDPDIYEGTGGNNIAMQLVMDGMKLQKCKPGFVDGRDAILLADRLNSGGRNQKLIWKAFAKRGLGYSADQGLSSSRWDGIEAFDIPEHLFTLNIEKFGEPVINAGTESNYKFKIKNNGDEMAHNLVIRDTLDDRLVVNITPGDCDWSIDGNVVSFTIDSLASFDSFVCELPVTIENYGFSAVSFTDQVEFSDKNWVLGKASGNGTFVKSSERKYSGDSAWFSQNLGFKSDRFLEGSFKLSNSEPALSFRHFYNTEKEYDGAVVEIDTGAGWTDLENDFILNGYNSRIGDNNSSAIANRSCFTGRSDGFLLSMVDLGHYAGMDVKIRFRFVSDGATGAEGWYIDDITVYDSLKVLTNRVSLAAENYSSSSSEVVGILLGSPTTSIDGRMTSGMNNLNIYPNPAGTYIIVQNTIGSETSVQLLDVEGRQVRSRVLQPGDKYKLDVADLARGIYFIKGITEGFTSTYKVIIQ